MIILLFLIYMAFISMGLPDSVLGSAWPSMYRTFSVPLSYAGLVSILISTGTVTSSLLSAPLIRRFGTGKVTAFSTLLTALALAGFSVSGSFFMLCLFAIPYGLGAGSIDVALNNFVAVKYKPNHMSWLHFCWGVGASSGPIIMGYILTNGGLWKDGYRTLSFIQLTFAAILLVSLPIWNRNRIDIRSDARIPGKRESALSLLNKKGVKGALASFFTYSAIEGTAGLWAASYFTLTEGTAPSVSAKWASFFFLGITAGRLLSGFIANRLGNKKMVYLGLSILFPALILMIISPIKELSLAGLLLAGLGCAPIYPSLIHQTPVSFGVENSQTIIGMQMACAFSGNIVMPPLFGIIAQNVSVSLYPFYLLASLIVMTFAIMSSFKAGSDLNGTLS